MSETPIEDKLLHATNFSVYLARTLEGEIEVRGPRFSTSGREPLMVKEWEWSVIHHAIKIGTYQVWAVGERIFDMRYNGRIPGRKNQGVIESNKIPENEKFPEDSFGLWCYREKKGGNVPLKRQDGHTGIPFP